MEKLFENWREYRKEALNEAVFAIPAIAKAAPVLKAALTTVKSNFIANLILKFFNYKVKGRPWYFWLLDGELYYAASGALLYELEQAKEGEEQEAFEKWLINTGVPIVLIRPVMSYIVEKLGSPGKPAFWARPDVIAIGVSLWTLYHFAMKYQKQKKPKINSQSQQEPFVLTPRTDPLLGTLFENWRRYIGEQNNSSLAKTLRGINHPKLGKLPPDKPTEDHYVEAVMEVARAMSNVRARKWYLSLARDKGLGEEFVKKSVELSYYIRGFLDPSDIARVTQDKYLSMEDDLRYLESAAAKLSSFTSPPPLPTPKEFSKAGLKKFNGNSVVEVKEANNRRWGWPTMIRFLNSLEVNPSVAKYAPWFVEDMSKLDIGGYKLGTKIYGHGSHRWGLDVDISVPTLSEQEFKGKEITGDVPLKGYVPTRKVKMSVSDKRRGSKESWNFDNLGRDVSKIDIDACINFIAHCLYGPGAGTEFIVEYIFIDKKIIAAIKQKLRQDIKAGKRSKRWLSRKIFGGKVKHQKNHFHHFHVRLYGTDEDVKKYISDKKILLSLMSMTLALLIKMRRKPGKKIINLQK